MKILLIRLDKIGDLVSTLPVDEIPALKGHEVRWAIARGLTFVPDNATPARNTVELDRFDRAGSSAKLSGLLSEWKPDLAVSFQAPWWVSWTLFRNGVRHRAGVRSQWHSFLFLNHGLRQKRSSALRHEADYNRELLEFALESSGVAADPVPTPILRMRPPAGELEETLGLPTPYVVVHPGMAGSALNWPQSSYARLIRRLSEKTTIAITGTAADEPFLTELRRECPESSRVRWLVGRLDAANLLRTLARASAILAPSTGVAHLGAALGSPVVALFSPIPVQRPERWAPRGPRVKIVLPPEPLTAPMEQSMDLISVDVVLAKIEASLT